MQNNFRLMTKKELDTVNLKIARSVGNQDRIICGSCERMKNGKVRYHITMLNSNSHKSPALLQKIGEHVMMILGGEEVYYLGTKIA